MITYKDAKVYYEKWHDPFMAFDDLPVGKRKMFIECFKKELAQSGMDEEAVRNFEDYPWDDAEWDEVIDRCFEKTSGTRPNQERNKRLDKLNEKYQLETYGYLIES